VTFLYNLSAIFVTPPPPAVAEPEPLDPVPLDSPQPAEDAPP
jgi:hypothetical protein